MTVVGELETELGQAKRKLVNLREQLAEALAVVRLTADQNLELAMAVKELKEQLREAKAGVQSHASVTAAMQKQLLARNHEIVELMDENERLKLKAAIRDQLGEG